MKWKLVCGIALHHGIYAYLIRCQANDIELIRRHKLWNCMEVVTPMLAAWGQRNYVLGEGRN